MIELNLQVSANAFGLATHKIGISSNVLTKAITSYIYIRLLVGLPNKKLSRVWGPGSKNNKKSH
jgi:hypothetical protein